MFQQNKKNTKIQAKLTRTLIIKVPSFAAVL